MKRSRSSKHPIFGAVKTTSHDPDSGLVYDEFEIAAHRGASTWVTDYRTPSAVKTRLRPNDEDGTRSLADTVLARLSLESYQLTPDALQSLPWALGEQIWKRILDRRAESFFIWRTFAMAFGNDFARPDLRYIFHIRNMSLPLIDYYRGLSDRDWRWHVCLRVSPKQVTASDLVALSAIQNLSVLDLSDGQLYIENRESAFDYRIVRTWSETAASGRGFLNLRVLLLGWQEKVDTWMFDYLRNFPKLNLVILSNCRLLHHKNHKDWEELAWNQGWEFMPSKRGVKHLRPLFDDKSFGKGIVSNMHYESLQMHYDGGNIPRKAQRPLLECWLGSPREWSHIVDDFPGTGTILLQRSDPFHRRSAQQVKDNTKASAFKDPAEMKSFTQTLISGKPPVPRKRLHPYKTADLLADFQNKSS